MTDKDYVKRYIPKARAEKQKTNKGETYWLIRDGNEIMYFASGKTQSNAWLVAKERIERKAVKEINL